MTDPDPRTAPDDREDSFALDDATDIGTSSQAPAEGGDDEPAGGPGSPQE